MATQKKDSKVKQTRKTLTQENHDFLNSIGLKRTKNFEGKKGMRASTQAVFDKVVKANEAKPLAIVIVPEGASYTVPKGAGDKVKVVKITGTISTAKSAMENFDQKNPGLYTTVVSQGCLACQRH